MKNLWFEFVFLYFLGYEIHRRYNGEIMNREDIFERLKVLIVEKFSVQEEDILISSKFSDFDADSLDIVDLVMGIESDFDIHIPDELVEKITSVEEAIYYIQEALESK